MAKPVVFISSTCEDLEKTRHRDAARDAALMAGFFPEMKEYWEAKDNPPLKECLARVEKADVLVVIVAYRFGWVPDSQPEKDAKKRKSITWLECEKAEKTNKDILAFLVDEDQEWPAELREEYKLIKAANDSKQIRKLASDIPWRNKRLGAFKTWLNNRAVRVTFTTPEDLQGKIATALKTLRQDKKIGEEPPQRKRRTGIFEPSPEAESEYRAVLKQELGTIKMLGSPDVPNIPVDLLDTFVSLDITVMSSCESREFLGQKEMRDYADRKLTPESALKRTFEKYRILLILGDPGSGKTTLVKYYAMLCLKGERHKELGFDEPPLVIYLPLREIESKDGELCPLHECLAKWASRHYISISADTFWGWLKNRQTLVLLDGLDEISDVDKRREICNWIDDAAEGLTNARFVVTSRWTGYRKVDGIEFEFDHIRADVKDFSEEQQAEFLEKWFIAAYLREPHDKKIPDDKWREGQRQRGIDRAKAIVDYLAKDENRGVRELAVVPMLLQVIAILWRERENLPQGRADLYQAALKYLLDYRDRRRKIKPLMPATQALRVLCPVSFWMQDELHSDEVYKDKLHVKMWEKLVNMKDNVPAEEFCENLRDRAGLISDYGDDAYIFRHKSFREYLAGLELKNQADRNSECLKRIVEQFGEDWWGEPLRFFMGEVDDTLFDQFMDVLFGSDVSKELDQKPYDLLLTMVDEAPERRIDSLVRRLNDASLSENQRRYIVDCLKIIGSEEAIEAIRAFGEKETGTGAGAYAKEIVAEQLPELIPEEAVKARDVFIALPPTFRNTHEYNAEYILIRGGQYKYSVMKKTETVPDIYFAKYQVTNKRYRSFIRYLKGGAVELSRILPLDRFYEEVGSTVEGFRDYLGDDPQVWPEKLSSEYYDEKRFNGQDQPVVGISWFAARAYCCWLSLLDIIGQELESDRPAGLYRLPTELEWEWATGGGEREYPWASEKGPPTDKLANYDDIVGATTSVGRYPDGATPEGLMDMAGNVWEWMENWHEKHKGMYRSLRGGSWASSEGSLRCSGRVYDVPDYRNDYIGFRVVRSQS